MTAVLITWAIVATLTATHYGVKSYDQHKRADALAAENGRLWASLGPGVLLPESPSGTPLADVIELRRR